MKHYSISGGGKLNLALWTFGKSIWDIRNKEIHGRSFQEARDIKNRRLEKEINYFSIKFQENQFLVLQRHRYLFDTTKGSLVRSTHDVQLAWLRSVKEAIEVRKQYDNAISAKQKDNFRKFFIVKRPTTSQSVTPPPDNNHEDNYNIQSRRYLLRLIAPQGPLCPFKGPPLTNM